MHCPGCGRAGRHVKTVDGQPSRAGICSADDCPVLTFPSSVVLTQRRRLTPYLVTPARRSDEEVRDGPEDPLQQRLDHAPAIRH
jgi:hypothetical protein